MSETQEEGVLPVLLLIAAATIAASTLLARLGYLHSPATPQKKTGDQRAKIKEIKELRKLKEDFLKAEGAEDVTQDESGVGSD